MAIGFVGSDSGHGSGVTTIALTLPTHSTDDVGLIFCKADEQGTVGAFSVTVASGWTQLVELNHTGGRDRVTAIFYKRFTSGSETNPTATFSISEQISASVHVFSGVDTTTMFDMVSPFYTQSNGTNVTAPTLQAFPSITTQTDNAAVVCFHGSSHDDIVNPVASSGYTIGEIVATASTDHRTQFTQYDLDVGTSGTISPGTATHDGGRGTQGDWTHYSVALRPLDDTVDVLTADDTESDSSVTSPVVGQEQVLLSDDVQSTSNVTNPVVAQVHALLATSIESTSEVDTPSASESHVLLADDISSTSNVSVPDVGQVQVLLGDDVSSTSNVTTPVIAQVHSVLANDVSSASEVTAPTAADVSSGDDLLAEDIESSSSVTTPVVAQVHQLLSTSIESTPELTLPSTGSSGILSILSPVHTESISSLTIPVLALVGDEFEDFTMGSGTMMMGSGDHQMVTGNTLSRNNIELLSVNGRFYALDKAG